MNPYPYSQIHIGPIAGPALPYPHKQLVTIRMGQILRRKANPCLLLILLTCFGFALVCTCNARGAKRGRVRLMRSCQLTTEEYDLQGWFPLDLEMCAVLLVLATGAALVLWGIKEVWGW